MKLRGMLVIVTGASSGLGRAIAARLASHEGADLIIAARRRERLESLALEITRCGRRAWVCDVDLGTPEGPAALMEYARAVAADEGRPLFGLVNNAGVTWYGAFSDMDGETLRSVLELNVVATIDLTRRFIESVRDENRVAPSVRPAAAILTITSLAAFVPVPYQAVYAASKHAIHAFSESLAFELREQRRRGGADIAVTAFAAGGIATEMIERSGLDRRFAHSRMLVPAERVAAEAIDAWKRERRSRVGGFANRVVALAGRVLPWGIVGRLAERMYRG
jgi:uncharacterized protein